MQKRLSNTVCPFLGEEKVVFCRAFPLKKPIPFDRLYSPENFCLKGNYRRCPIYREVADKDRGEQKRICPFVELETMTYCKLFPAKKITVSGAYDPDNLCCTERYRECPLFLAVSRGDLSSGSYSSVRGFLVDPTAKYLKEHLWVREDGEGLKLGLDDFAQFLIGLVKRVSLPRCGKPIRRGEGLLVLETEKGTLELSLPFEGEVLEGNGELERDPSLLNHDPYGRGWLLKVKPQGKIGELMLAEEAKQWLSEEVQRLCSLLGSGEEMTLADGGEPSRDWLRGLDPRHWQALIGEFLGLGETSAEGKNQP